MRIVGAGAAVEVVVGVVPEDPVVAATAAQIVLAGIAAATRQLVVARAAQLQICAVAAVDPVDTGTAGDAVLNLSPQDDLDADWFESHIRKGRSALEARPAEALGWWRGRALEKFMHEAFAQPAAARLVDGRVAAAATMRTCGSDSSRAEDPA